RPLGRDQESEPADRRYRGPGPRRRGALRGPGAAGAGLRRAGLSGGAAAQVPIPRSAARHPAPQYYAASRRDQLDPPPHDRAGVHRIPDADPDRLLAGGRARLPGALAPASGQVLRPAAGPAAVQAAADGLWLRPLLPDRALLPR